MLWCSTTATLHKLAWGSDAQHSLSPGHASTASALPKWKTSAACLHALRFLQDNSKGKVDSAAAQEYPSADRLGTLIDCQMLVACPSRRSAEHRVVWQAA